MCFQKCFALNVSFYEWLFWFCFNCPDLFRVGLLPLIFRNPTHNRKLIGSWSTVTATHTIQCKSHLHTWQKIIVYSVTSPIQIMLQQECVRSSALNVVHTRCLMTKNKRELAWHCNQAINRHKVPLLPLQCQCKDLSCKLILPAPNLEIPCHDMI